MAHESHGFDARVARLAARQLGLVTRAQANEQGLAHHVIRARLRARRWEELHRGVYRLAGAPPSKEQLTLAAVFAAGPGAAASHRSAAALWELPGTRVTEPEVSVPYERNPAPSGVRVYRSRTLGTGDVTRIGPVPITTPARTLVDLCAVMGAEAVEDALDDALQRRLVSQARLASCIAAARYGVPGVGTLRALLALRTGGHLGESTFENRLRRLLVASGLPMPAAQYVVRDDRGKPIGRVDLAYPEARLAIEADGYAFHSGRRAFERDRERQNSLTNAGWRVLRVTPTQLEADGKAVVATVAAALELSVKRK